MKKIIKNIVHSFGYDIVWSKTLDQLELKASDNREHFDVMASENRQLFELVARVNGIGQDSKAQLHQDLFVLLETGFKKHGFFVEFGATNGVDLSNTYLLEKRFHWKGILAEPATVWHQDLERNRNASIEFDCVWSESGKTLKFNMVDAAEYSTIKEFSDSDGHYKTRNSGALYDVKTVSLFDLLKRHKAPQTIDYLSIDTEGSEFEILRDFDFDSYHISIITCEHNFTKNRQKVYELLTSKGYERKFSGLSQFDDWYVK